MNKLILILIALLFIPSVSQAQTNLKASELNALTTPDSADIIIIGDVSATESKKITYGNFVSGIGGTGLGANLSSSNNGIFSNTGTITFGDDNLSTTGTMSAGYFVSTGGTMSIFDDLTILNDLRIPVFQDCSTLLSTGEVCIDGNISGMTDAMSFKGTDGEERININMLKSAIVSINDNDSLYFDDATNSWVTLPANLPFWDGVDGSQVYPLTPATTDIYIGGNTSGTADHWIKATGGMVINQQNADENFNVQGDTIEYLVYTVDDQIAIGTNTPAIASLMTVQGTLSVTGTLDGAITFDNLPTSDPCTSAGTREIKNNSFFIKTGGVPCYCDNSGVDKKLVDDSACF